MINDKPAHNGKFNEFRGFEESLSLRHLFRANLDLYVSNTIALRLSSISPSPSPSPLHAWLYIYGCEKARMTLPIFFNLLHMIWIDQHI